MITVLLIIIILLLLGGGRAYIGGPFGGVDLIGLLLFVILVVLLVRLL